MDNVTMETSLRLQRLISSFVGLAGTALVSAGMPALAADQPHPGSAARRKAAVTYARDVAPIVFKQCVSCHRPGQIGPFPLLTYQDARKRAQQIAAVTRSR